MANTFKTVTLDLAPASSGTPQVVYTTPSSTTTIVIGLFLCNVHTAQVTASVKLVSDTSGGGRTATNTTSFLAKDIPLATGQTKNALMGGKQVLETTDAISVDCSVADKVSVSMSILEIT
tara:strand:- start:90 stop:449 length:360 start_codon:yes stop_codon:yes gene_type:complete